MSDSKSFCSKIQLKVNFDVLGHICDPVPLNEAMCEAILIFWLGKYSYTMHFHHMTYFVLVMFVYVFVCLHLVAPVIAVKRHTYTVTEDQGVILQCEATGVPEPVIRWMKNGQELPGNTAGYNLLANGDLVIPVVREEDAGLFVCLAHNPVNIVQAQRMLEVQG